MNKTIIKVLALTLALLMVLPLAIACKKEEEVLETEAGSVVETESIHAVPPQDLGGKEFEFGVSKWAEYEPLNFIDLYVEAYTGDFVEDAVKYLIGLGVDIEWNSWCHFRCLNPTSEFLSIF